MLQPLSVRLMSITLHATSAVYKHGLPACTTCDSPEVEWTGDVGRVAEVGQTQRVGVAKFCSSKFRGAA